MNLKVGLCRAATRRSMTHMTGISSSSNILYFRARRRLRRSKEGRENFCCTRLASFRLSA